MKARHHSDLIGCSFSGVNENSVSGEGEWEVDLGELKDAKYEESLRGSGK